MTKKNWFRIVEAFRNEEGVSDGSEIAFLPGYSICPGGIIASRSKTLYELWFACGGVERITLPSDFLSLPAVYLDAGNVIEAELKRLEAYKDGVQ